MLFGDGAGALILSGEPTSPGAGAWQPLRVIDVLLMTDGSYARDLTVCSPGTANGARWITEVEVRTGLCAGSMNGRVVILQAVRRLCDAAREITARNRIGLSEVAALVPHQANLNLLRAVGKRLEIPAERIVINVDRYGNASGASAFLALSQARSEMNLRPGDYVLILAFAAGFTWGAALCQVE
jgi:3-oxoacyl-[acyl-carrier-protein] synthase-3